FKEKEEEVRARQFQPSTDNVCSCCGQALPPEQVEEVNKKAVAKFNKQQSEDLENLKQKTEKILSDGKEIKPLIER
ncbi:ATPase, partial [Staphylococcus epidermidis]|nr:ATPase [Staphylococcus epidermidis]